MPTDSYCSPIPLADRLSIRRWSGPLFASDLRSSRSSQARAALQTVSWPAVGDPHRCAGGAAADRHAVAWAVSSAGAPTERCSGTCSGGRSAWPPRCGPRTSSWERIHARCRGRCCRRSLAAEPPQGVLTGGPSRHQLVAGVDQRRATTAAPPPARRSCSERAGRHRARYYAW